MPVGVSRPFFKRKACCVYTADADTYSVSDMLILAGELLSCAVLHWSLGQSPKDRKNPKPNILIVVSRRAVETIAVPGKTASSGQLERDLR